ncbi:MAG: Ldh family oxidoreductase [Verrucomicrobiales bacterium]|nr:Ldh family oxidoreductase [Verrucomicrobiales bacterium]
MAQQESFYIVPTEQHDQLVRAAYIHRGFNAEEANAAAAMCSNASHHGIRTHNALKALHLDELFGSGSGGCVPNAEIEVIESKFKAVQTWNANRKLGQAVATQAMNTCMELADEYGVGIVAVDNAFHYLWGGGYVIDAAKKGYIAYTNCTSTLSEVVPFGGKYPTLGTNPHSWAFPTVDAVGYPVVLDWATSTIAMGRVQQIKREGGELPPNAAIDADGNMTTDPNQVAALLPFGAHKGYGLCLLNELYGAVIGGSLPTLRGRADLAKAADEKSTTAFYFQVIHPDALSGQNFSKGRTQAENITAVIEDVLGHGNENCMLPGTIEANNAKRSDQSGGLLFSAAELAEFSELASECQQDPTPWSTDTLPIFEEA